MDEFIEVPLNRGRLKYFRIMQMKREWTEEQKNAIKLHDRSLLVSASAGTGKTAVLVERVISMLTDAEHPVDVDRLLVLTFTRSAASSMRQRIGDALFEALKKDPANVHLKRQQSLVHTANISTIHSFCLGVVKSHIHCIDIDPNFRIADEGELRLLRQDVCTQVLENFYKQGDEDFFRFADGYSSARSDEAIREMIEDLYLYSASYPWPDEWLDACIEQYRAETVEELEQKPWAGMILSYIHACAGDMIRRHRELISLCEMPGGPSMYTRAIRGDLLLLENIYAAKSLFDLEQIFFNIRYEKLKSSKGFAGNADLLLLVRDGREKMKKQISGIKKHFFLRTLKEELPILSCAGDMTEVLIRLTLAFSKLFSKEKKRRNMLDFSDIEHLALNILVDKETKAATAAAAEYRKRFAEIMVDEYQDSSFLQEAILLSVSGTETGCENLFMVGDAKQSIYRFRQARPQIFTDKYNTFSAEEGKRQRINLNLNFRSRKNVIDTVNLICRPLMRADIGGIDYGDDAVLRAGLKYPDYDSAECTATELLFTPDITGDNRKTLEAKAIAVRIKRMVEEEEIPGISYRDIVILLRSMQGFDESFRRAFEAAGIPLALTSGSGYFSSTEVQTVLNLLRIIDNPRQDIALASVMKSPIGNFSSEEMALIRVSDEARAFCETVINYAENRDKINTALKDKLDAFWEKINRLRAMSAYTSIHRLIQIIFSETGYLDYVSILPAGVQRRANLKMLLKKAIDYEESSYHGLFQFVKYIDKLIKYEVDYGEALAFSEDENAVRLMTIHGSKGLEFPVVIVAGLGKGFNNDDYTGSVLFHPEYGVGLKFHDGRQRIRKNTLIRSAFALQAMSDSLGEEMRLLYVALTRAKEKLILSGARALPDGGEKKTEGGGERKESPKMSAVTNGILDYSSRIAAKNYWDWIMPILENAGNPYTAEYFGDTANETFKETAPKHFIREQLLRGGYAIDADPGLLSQMRRALEWKYSHGGETKGKQLYSVSELKRLISEDLRIMSNEEEDIYSLPPPIPYLPKFVQDRKECGGLLYGTAMHRLVSCLDFAGMPDPDKKDPLRQERYLSDQIDSLISHGLMEEDECLRLSIRSLLIFLSSDAALMMKRAALSGTLRREESFLMSVPRMRIFPEMKSEDSVIVQGIIDAFWEEGEGIFLLDFKTDSAERDDELISRYRIQLLIYAEALERSFPEKKIMGIWIYSFSLGRLISIERT